ISESVGLRSEVRRVLTENQASSDECCVPKPIPNAKVAAVRSLKLRDATTGGDHRETAIRDAKPEAPKAAAANKTALLLEYHPVMRAPHISPRIRPAMVKAMRKCPPLVGQ